MPHKELAGYVNGYVTKNVEVLRPVALSLQVLCWPHMNQLDEVRLHINFTPCHIVSNFRRINFVKRPQILSFVKINNSLKLMLITVWPCMYFVL